jgi:2-phospho-L-lactate/phosphoenolpyruvate guanylyltransferase
LKPALLIPVKDLRHAKQRLAALFTREERTALAEAMLDDFYAVIRATRGAERIILVSSHEAAIERARGYGWEVIREASQISESASVDAASRWCEDHRITSLLRLPIDLPLLQPEDVDWLLQHARPGPSMTIVASRDGTGTNALLRTPPTLFPSHFGSNSFPKHLAEARQLGAHCTVLRGPRLEMDLDDEADLRAYLAQSGPPNATRKWVESHADGLASYELSTRARAEQIATCISHEG